MARIQVTGDLEITSYDQAVEILGELLPMLTSHDIRDEHHSMAELYHYRMLYNAVAIMAWRREGISVVKSLKHHDGEFCFGGGWFIVTAQLPTGQVSNHYQTQHWDLFAVPEVEEAPQWDGHTPDEAAKRIKKYLMGEH